MNFDQDYKEFIEHLTKAKGLESGSLSRREDVAVRLFTAYLNIRYEKASFPSNKATKRDR